MLKVPSSTGSPTTRSRPRPQPLSIHFCLKSQEVLANAASPQGGRPISVRSGPRFSGSNSPKLGGNRLSSTCPEFALANASRASFILTPTNIKLDETQRSSSTSSLMDAAGQAIRRRVNFCPTPNNTSHDVTPYGRKYGKHPKFFNFDRKGEMQLTNQGVIQEMRIGRQEERRKLMEPCEDIDP